MLHMEDYQLLYLYQAIFQFLQLIFQNRECVFWRAIKSIIMIKWFYRWFPIINTADNLETLLTKTSENPPAPQKKSITVKSLILLFINTSTKFVKIVLQNLILYEWACKIASFCKFRFWSVGLRGLQMCLNVGGVSSSFFFAGGRKNKINFIKSNCPVKKLNPFFRYYLSLSFLSVVCLFTLVANGSLSKNQFD